MRLDRGAMFPERVETARLVLRKPRHEDAAAIYREYAQDPAVTRYLVWTPHSSVEATEVFVAASIEHWVKGTAYPYVITGRTGADVLGMVELRPHAHRAEIGYVIGRRFWRNGIGTEAISAVVRIALADPGICRVEATCDVANTASARVLEKSGFAREGMLRRYAIHPNISPEPRDSYVYSIVR